jgi:hypothetical protein
MPLRPVVDAVSRYRLYLLGDRFLPARERTIKPGQLNRFLLGCPWCFQAIPFFMDDQHYQKCRCGVIVLNGD